MRNVQGLATDVQRAVNQGRDGPPAEGVSHVVVPVNTLTGQGNEERAGRRLTGIDDDLADALPFGLATRVVSG